ncbi:MAG: threonine/serine dehydratase [Pseudomonadota bacterium]
MTGHVTREGIGAAAERIAGHVRATPVIELPRGSLGGDWIPVLKLEFLQISGSFKARGAFNAILSARVGPAGVAAASGGNHGAAVACAAGRLGHPARIFVPDIAAPAKIAAIRRWGAEVVIAGSRFEEAQAACDAHVAATGALRVHPFGAAPTILGQGTLFREWDGQARPLDTVLVAVGGGGLVSGAAVWWDGSGPRIVGVEPEGAPTLHAALAAGGPVDVAVGSIAADSLGARNVGDLVFGLCRNRVAHVALVPDAAIAEAQRRLWSDLRIAVEPGGATALAAALAGKTDPRPGERVGVLVCGANVDLGRLAQLAE